MEEKEEEEEEEKGEAEEEEKKEEQEDEEEERMGRVKRKSRSIESSYRTDKSPNPTTNLLIRRTRQARSNAGRNQS